MNIQLEENEILVLKTVDSEGKAYNNFQYPLEIGAVVTAPDWNPEPVCGCGLHGLPWGVGGASYLSTKASSLWLLLVVNTSRDYVHGVGDLKGKCKFKSGRIAYIGDKVDAIALLQKYAPADTPIVYSNQVGCDKSSQTAGYRSAQTAGDWSTQTAGDESTQTAGHYSTQTAGYVSTQTAGNESTQIAGDESTQKAGNESAQTAGDASTQTARYGSTQTAGNESTQTAGDESVQTAGDESTQTAGDESTQTAGGWSTQTAGNSSTQNAGVGTVQICQYWIDGKHCVATRVITEAEANKPYFFENGVWTEVKEGK